MILLFVCLVAVIIWQWWTIRAHRYELYVLNYTVTRHSHELLILRIKVKELEGED